MVMNMKNLPSHVAIIMDGNRRFAKRLMKKPWKGHEWGAKKIASVIEWCKELGIKYITIYALSIQNFDRPKREFNFLMKLFEKEFLALCNPNHKVHKYKVRVKAIGRIRLLPKRVQSAIKKAEKATKKYKECFLNISIAYGGQEEILDMIKKIIKKVSKEKLKLEDVDKNLIKNNLYSDFPYPDLIIRTGNRQRLSNFLLWQSAYSEIFFVKKMWPEFSKNDFLSVIEEFQERKRSFGR
jgi:tritrans,polycis-undecaprenyl-diphosphate synthase [geranylgeranyl-diphosphate specific]